jgi:hypothetical protein
LKHEKELDGLNKFGPHDTLLDLGVEVGSKLQQPEYLQPELIVALGRFRMGLVFSAIQLPGGWPALFRLHVPLLAIQTGGTGLREAPDFAFPPLHFP